MGADYYQLPKGFLKKGLQEWGKLSDDVRNLVLRLAKEQNFKCALCNKDRDLIIEHDHDPEEGPGKPYTIYNIRGIVCERCNWHLNYYEKQESGLWYGWDHAECTISSGEYEDYIYFYKCRIGPLLEEAHEARVGCRNPERRRLVLQKFDAWHDEGEYSEWRSRWERNRALRIETPEDALRVLLACLRFVKEQIDKDPNGQIPTELVDPLIRIWPLVETIVSMAGNQTSITPNSEVASA